MSTGVVITEELLKNYGDTQALRGLNLRARRGIFGFIGPNGAGKTTTIRILTGALKPSGGKAYVLGYDCVVESLKIRKKIGVLHEKPSYPKELTGYGFLLFVGKLYGLSGGEATLKARKMFRVFDLQDVASRPIGHYSAGMKQRLGLAQALMGNPELIILDEPTASLDPLERMELLERITRLHREEGASFLISSHILPELEKVCDQIGIIDNGIILEQGSISRIASKYFKNTFGITTSNVATLAEELEKLECVETMYTDRDTVWVNVSNPEKIRNEVARISRERGLQLQLFKQVHRDLGFLYKTILEKKVKDKVKPAVNRLQS